MAAVDLIGSSATFRALLDEIEMVAPVDSAVLIHGETGTGKEVIARAIHEASPRHRNRFVALNCAAIPGTLLESELFGYEKGAFTGAVAQTMGRFQTADHGTLFLDEIGDLPLELQPKLLRALQEKQIERLGGGHIVHVNVRIIAATNQDLGRMVRERKFRADLFYRLNVFPMTLPLLRDRSGDIALLAEHFVQKFAKEQGKFIERIPEDVIAALLQHDWPGNIRELQNVIERGVIMTTGAVLSRQTVEHLKACQIAVAELPRTKTLADAERAHITATLRETDGVIGGPRGAAAQLGLPRTTLMAKMQRLGLSSGTRKRSDQLAQQFVRVRDDSPSHSKERSAGDLRLVEAVAG
jgi:transcriptional regulator with GAF, ATPase, and Fis domain